MSRDAYRCCIVAVDGKGCSVEMKSAVANFLRLRSAAMFAINKQKSRPGARVRPFALNWLGTTQKSKLRVTSQIEGGC